MNKLIFILFIAFFTLQITISQPQIEWHRTYNSPINTDDFATSLAIDSSGNIITLGWTLAVGSNGGYIINKYTPSGQLLWTAQYFETTGLTLRSKKVCVDAQNNVYVTGSKGSIVTVKFNSLGVLQWVRRYNGLGSSISEPHDMEIDRNGFIYITGESSVQSTFFDYVTIKYNQNGDSLWTRTYNGIGNGIDRARALEVDSIGNVYITGDSESLHDTAYFPDVTSIKYDSLGNTVWVNRYVNKNILNGYSYDLKLDKSSNLYSCGFFIEPSFIGFLMKYDQFGNTIWVKTIDSITQVNGKFNINVDINNNIYFIGNGRNYPPGNYYVIKYNPLGNILFQKSIQPIPPYEAVFETSCIDNHGNIYITGGKYTAKIDSLGNLVWNFLNIVNDSSYTSVSILLDSESSIYMCGNFGYNFLTIKYNQLIGIEPVSNNLPLSFKLYSNFPNPFNPLTVIKWDVAKKTKLKIILYDILGRELEKLVDKELNAGSYKVTFDGMKYSSGVYFYTLQTENYRETKKMILIK